MRRLAKITLPLLILAFIAGALVYGWHRSTVQRIGLETTLEWARLAPLPSTAQGVRVTTEGSMFTRGFRISFTAPPDVLHQWVAESPGPSSATPEETGTKTKYEIEPGGGAQHAEMTIDFQTGEVHIYVYWS